MCCAVPSAPCGVYPSSTYRFSGGGDLEVLAGVEPGEELDPQAATRGSKIDSINVSQKVDFFSIAFSLLCSYERMRCAQVHHIIFRALHLARGGWFSCCRCYSLMN